MEREGHWQLRTGNRARFFERPSAIFTFNILNVTHGWEAERPTGGSRVQRCKERVFKGILTLLERRLSPWRVCGVPSQGQHGSLLRHGRVSPIVFAFLAGMISCCGSPGLGRRWHLALQTIESKLLNISSFINLGLLYMGSLHFCLHFAFADWCQMPSLVTCVTFLRPCPALFFADLLGVCTMRGSTTVFTASSCWALLLLLA